jgi:hypothetical protein
LDCFEIPHGGQTLRMTPLTAGVKQAFVAWLRPRYILQAMAILEDGKAAGITGDDLKKLEMNVVQARQEANAGGLFWSIDPSQAVASALMTEAGVVKLARLMFPVSMDGWTDAQIYAYLSDQKEGSAYQVAFGLAWEDADPKANRKPGTTSAVPPASNG